MTEETNQPDTATTEANPPKAAPKPRAPRLTAVYDGAEHPFLKYPFPVKAPRFSVHVNGEACEAATTGGRGKEYTYILVKNTSFYVPGVVPHEANVTVEFPEDYKFDESVTERKSYYKPKTAKVGDEGDGPKTDETATGGETDPGTSADEPESTMETLPGKTPTKAARRRK